MPDPSPLFNLPTWLLARGAGRAHRILSDRLGDVGFTGYEYRVLAALAAHGRQNQADIGRAAALDRRDVTHTVRRLDERGLIERSDDPNNRRVVLVALTDEGRRAWSRLQQVMMSIQAEVLAPLSAEEAAVLVELLERLNADPPP